MADIIRGREGWVETGAVPDFRNGVCRVFYGGDSFVIGLKHVFYGNDGFVIGL
jgi:hypothetical protein